MFGIFSIRMSVHDIHTCATVNDEETFHMVVLRNSEAFTSESGIIDELIIKGKTYDQ